MAPHPRFLPGPTPNREVATYTVLKVALTTVLTVAQTTEAQGYATNMAQRVASPEGFKFQQSKANASCRRALAHVVVVVALQSPE